MRFRKDLLTIRTAGECLDPVYLRLALATWTALVGSSGDLVDAGKHLASLVSMVASVLPVV